MFEAKSSLISLDRVYRIRNTEARLTASLSESRSYVFVAVLNHRRTVHRLLSLPRGTSFHKEAPTFVVLRHVDFF